MTRTTKLVTLAAAAVIVLALSLLVGQLAPASGAPARHHHRDTATTDCISSTEFYTAQRGTMSWFQETYSTGPGSVVWHNGDWSQLVKQYPWCNHTTAQGYFQVQYGLNSRGQYMANYVTWFNATRQVASRVV